MRSGSLRRCAAWRRARGNHAAVLGKNAWAEAPSRGWGGKSFHTKSGVAPGRKAKALWRETSEAASLEGGGWAKTPGAIPKMCSLPLGWDRSQLERHASELELDSCTKTKGLRRRISLRKEPTPCRPTPLPVQL